MDPVDNDGDTPLSCAGNKKCATLLLRAAFAKDVK